MRLQCRKRRASGRCASRNSRHGLEDPSGRKAEHVGHALKFRAHAPRFLGARHLSPCSACNGFRAFHWPSRTWHCADNSPCSSEASRDRASRQVSASGVCCCAASVSASGSWSSPDPSYAGCTTATDGSPAISSGQARRGKSESSYARSLMRASSVASWRWNRLPVEGSGASSVRDRRATPWSANPTRTSPLVLIRVGAAARRVRALALLVPLALASSQGDPMPPTELDGAGRAGVLLRTGTADVVASVNSSLANRSVSFRWSWKPNPTASHQNSVQSEAVAFWPTDVQSVGPNQLAVAGIVRNRTVIELWTLDAITLPSAAIGENGVTAYGKLHVAIASKRLVFESSATGMRGVQWMSRNPVTPTGAIASLFVLFHDSRSVYEITLLPGQDATAVLRVASTATPNVLVQPGLLGRIEGKVLANHSSWGFVHMFTPVYDAEPQAPTIVLYDQDRNGSLDGTLVVSAAEWTGQGWGESDSYLPMP